MSNWGGETATPAAPSDFESPTQEDKKSSFTREEGGRSREKKKEMWDRMEVLAKKDDVHCSHGGGSEGKTKREKKKNLETRQEGFDMKKDSCKRTKTYEAQWKLQLGGGRKTTRKGLGKNGNLRPHGKRKMKGLKVGKYRREKKNLGPSNLAKNGKEGKI